MKLVITDKGAGLVTEGEYKFEDGVIPTRTSTWHCWCFADDAQYAEFIAHCKTLV